VHVRSLPPSCSCSICMLMFLCTFARHKRCWFAPVPFHIPQLVSSAWCVAASFAYEFARGLHCWPHAACFLQCATTSWLQHMLATYAACHVPHMSLLHTSFTMPPVVKLLGQCLPSGSVLCRKPEKHYSYIIATSVAWSIWLTCRWLGRSQSGINH
jgi:hypothetical protein